MGSVVKATLVLQVDYSTNGLPPADYQRSHHTKLTVCLVRDRGLHYRPARDPRRSSAASVLRYILASRHDRPPGLEADRFDCWSSPHWAVQPCWRTACAQCCGVNRKLAIRTICLVFVNDAGFSGSFVGCRNESACRFVVLLDSNA